jgi:hypothetical protein
VCIISIIIPTLHTCFGKPKRVSTLFPRRKEPGGRSARVQTWMIAS